MSGKTRSVIFTHVDQNMTEGHLTPEFKRGDLCDGQEVNGKFVRKELRSHTHIIHPRTQLSISWDPKVFKNEGPKVPVRLHKSGRAEGWRDPIIRSPARFVIIKPLEIRRIHVPLSDMNTWLINSWTDPTPDRTTDQRRQIAMESLEQIAKEVIKQHQMDRLVKLSGDFNTARGNILRILNQFGANLREATDGKGLTRVLYSKDKRISVYRKPVQGRKTGVGRDMRHNSVITQFRVTR